MDDNCKWSRAAFRIFGETLQPEEIGSMLSLEATRTHLKGELLSPRYKATRRASFWHLLSPLGDESNMVDHLKWLLDALEPKLDVIRELTKHYKVDLFCGFSSENGQGGFTLDTATLARLAELGVPVLDLYPPGPVEIDDINVTRC